MGRKAIPIAIQKVRGNPSKRKLPEELKPTEGVMRPDVDLCDVARAKYYELIQETHWGLVVTCADNDQLCDYCRIYAAKIKADIKLALEGEVLISKEGGKYQNPWFAVVNKYRTDMKKIASEFGGTPSGRVKLGGLIKNDNAEDEFNQLISGANQQKPSQQSKTPKKPPTTRKT